MEQRRPQIYRELIDELVYCCQHGQGTIGPRRARSGVWNQNARPDFLQDQYAINELLSRMPSADRETLAGMLADAFEAGVHDTLRVLYERQIDPFDDAYEGDPFHDFIGRLGDWPWPE